MFTPGRKNFTLIELMITIVILVILAGLLLPALYESRLQAKYARWFAYNNSLNRDPKLVLNYNFQQRGFRVNGEEVVHNGGEGCTIDGYKPVEYHAKMKQDPEWLPDSGRWRLHNKAMLFDGVDDCLQVDGKTIFTQHKDNDFTLISWVFFDEFFGIQTIASRSIWPDFAEFIIYAQNNQLTAEVGDLTLTYTGENFSTNRWLQVALINSNGNVKLYLNGKVVDSELVKDSNRIVIFHAVGNGGYILMVTSAHAWNGHKNHPGDYIVSTDPLDYFKSTYADELAATTFTVGAANLLSGSRGYFFKGKMDEVVFIKRAMKESEVRANYEMGNPY